MKLLIVGAAGQLGTDMARFLAPVSAVTALTFDGLDITDRPSLKQAIESARPDVMVNYAASTAADRVETDPAIVWQTAGDLQSELNGRAIPLTTLPGNEAFICPDPLRPGDQG